MVLAACLATPVIWNAGCDSKKSAPPAAPPAAASPDLRADLALARVDLAKQAVARRAPEEALALLVSAMEADPSCGEALLTASDILQNTRWFLPEVSINHAGLTIDHLELDNPSSLWVALSLDDGADLKSSVQTVVKWNLETMRIENVLFPVRGNETSCMLFDPGHRYAVIKRSYTSSGDTVLLCDAQTLKPIRNLGPLPDFLTPSAVIVFSADGLLVAHPTYVSDKDRTVIWQLRDTRTGEIIRTSSPTPPDQPAPVAAFLDRSRLRVMHTDGVLLEMPVSPVEPETRKSILKPVRLLQAQFSADGTSLDALEQNRSNEKPRRMGMIIDENKPSNSTLNGQLERFPWSSHSHPNIWNGLLREVPYNPIKVDQTRVSFPNLPFPSYDVNSDITAVALRGDRIAISGGTLNIYQTLPLPAGRKSDKPFSPETLSAAEITAFARLSETLTGHRHDSTTRKLVRSDPARRLDALRECDFEAITRIFPLHDFDPLIARIRQTQARTATAEAMVPLWNRFASADTGGKTWPELLKPHHNMSTTPWHKDLAIAVEARTSGKEIQPESSSWLAPLAVAEIFTSGNREAIMSAIRNAGAKGPKAAKALELSLASEHPEWIALCLETAADLPPFLHQLAHSRIAWLEDRKADALGVWPDEFPDLEKTRLYQDWDGWEQADFRPAYQELHRCMSKLLADLEVPSDATPEQRREVAERIENPETLKAVGHARLAAACLKAAFAFSKFKEEKETTFRIAAIARSLGAAPEPCLRAEAIALTAMGDYQQAHARWVQLITEHPVATHEPGDYAEAAYTAFENSNPQQAMVILTTGIHRFPGDANFALRAGWVALLTGNSDRAYRFLLGGRQIGFPREKLENATALLAIAAAQSGATDDAAVFYQDLIGIDPDWEDPATIDTLEWPEELKAALRQLAVGELPL
jgi:tetratricopeptide (TPR) repeat protein